MQMGLGSIFLGFFCSKKVDFGLSCTCSRLAIANYFADLCQAIMTFNNYIEIVTFRSTLCLILFFHPSIHPLCKAIVLTTSPTPH